MYRDIFYFSKDLLLICFVCSRSPPRRWWALRGGPWRRRSRGVWGGALWSGACSWCTLSPGDTCTDSCTSSDNKHNIDTWRTHGMTRYLLRAAGYQDSECFTEETRQQGVQGGRGLKKCIQLVKEGGVRWKLLVNLNKNDLILDLAFHNVKLKNSVKN